MKTDALYKFGTAYVIRESLHQDHHLGSIGASVRADFEVAEAHVLPGGVESDVLVSTSLFNQNGAVPTGPWNYEMFNATVIASASPEKYWDALRHRRAEYAGKRLRVYLAANLAGLVKPLLEEVGFDEVLLMARPSEGYKTGMLWRYLPLCEAPWSHVFCSGIDRYDATGDFVKTMLQPGPNMTASVWMNRHFLPFCGPLSARPEWVRATYGVDDIASAMSGFLDAWEQPALAPTYTAKVFDFTGRSKGVAMPTIDACFLWYAFWNSQLMEVRPRFVSQVFYEYSRIHLVDFLLGGVGTEL